ncbi:hypothetical protein Pmani_037639 [Petrolisthes manimaculis]|uniref:Uncharacterized protein n=1 Tax=Petrolisthes manimaculis TaxID=1843537 RepID=A0AAE1TN39_9EUCA|nr:hypothetical protein Pmani_037639 [Petrolisthes manimaculis]
MRAEGQAVGVKRKSSDEVESECDERLIRNGGKEAVGENVAGKSGDVIGRQGGRGGGGGGEGEERWYRQAGRQAGVVVVVREKRDGIGRQGWCWW